MNLKKPGLRLRRQVWLTIKSRSSLCWQIPDQQIFHCSSITKSLLYSSVLRCLHCVCTHSLEHNPILRSNPRLEQSKRALLYSAKPLWGGWGDFPALSVQSAGSVRGENRREQSWDLQNDYNVLLCKAQRQILGAYLGEMCSETLQKFRLVCICRELSRKHRGATLSACPPDAYKLTLFFEAYVGLIDSFSMHHS